MACLLGVYAYELPERITGGIGGVRLERISEEPASFRRYPAADRVDVLIARQGAVNEMLQAFPNVRWLQLLNAGFEKVDLEQLRSRGIVFTNARSVYCSTIAEDVMAKILILSRNYLRHFADQQRHFWPDDVQLPNGNLDLAGRTLGILGAGAIGREVALRAGCFGMTVRGYDPYRSAQEGFASVCRNEEGLKRLLQESDFIVTSLPVTEETKHMINARTLALMRPTAFLINVARGEIIEEVALIRALNQGRIRGAALDVAETEPLPADSPLWTAERLVITPHRAAYGDGMQARMCGLIERNLRHYLAGEPLEDRIL